MADVFRAFIQGQAAGQAQIAHKQQMEDSRLRQQILRHEIENLKISDQIRERKIAEQNLQLLHGQPAADIPSDEVPTQQSIPTAQGVPDVIRKMALDRLAGPTGQPMLPESAPMPAPEPMAPERFQTTERVAKMINVPGVGNQPGVNVRPESRESLQAQLHQLALQKQREAIAQKMLEPYTLNAGDRRYAGDQLLATGGPRSPTRASLAYDAALGDQQAQTATESMRPRGPAARAPVERNVSLDGQPAKVLFHPDTQTYTDLDGTPIEGAATRIRPTSREATQGQQTYSVAQRAAAERWKQKELAAAEKKWKDTQPTGYHAKTGAPILRRDGLNEVTPMTAAELEQEKQRIQNSYLEQIGASQGTRLSATPKEGDTRPIPDHPGWEATFKAGKWIRTK